MNTPSIKTLSAVFGDNAKEAKRLLTCDTKEIQYDCVIAHRKACYNPPQKYMVRLLALNEVAQCYGVESFCSTNDEYLSYLNTGETYSPTLIYWRGQYRIQSVGDFVETMERQGVHFN